MFTARFAASRLDVNIEVLIELGEQMEPEDDRLSVIDNLDENAATITIVIRKRLDYL